MGLRSDGTHVFGLITKKDPKTREATEMAVVEATGYAIASGPEGLSIAFSDVEGTLVAAWGPGEWEDIDIDFTDDPDGFKIGEEPEGFYEELARKKALE